MFASSVRDRPCSARACCVSSARVTVSSLPSLRSSFTSGWNVRRSSPFGPFTTTSCPLIFTSTPLATGMGILPMRLIALPYLPDVRQDLATEALLLRVAAGHEARRRGDDRDAEAAEHARHLGLARVDAEPGLRDPADAGHRGHLAADVLQLHREVA